MPARPRMTSPSTVQAQRPGLLVGSFRSREPFPVEKRRVRAAASLAVSQRLACDVARDRAALATDPDRGCCCPCALHRPPLFPLLRALLSPPPSSAAPRRAFPRNAARRRRPRCRCPPARPIHRRCRRAPSPSPLPPPPLPGAAPSKRGCHTVGGRRVFLAVGHRRVGSHPVRSSPFFHPFATRWRPPRRAAPS